MGMLKEESSLGWVCCLHQKRGKYVSKSGHICPQSARRFANFSAPRIPQTGAPIRRFTQKKPTLHPNPMNPEKTEFYGQPEITHALALARWLADEAEAFPLSFTHSLTSLPSFDISHKLSTVRQILTFRPAVRDGRRWRS